MEWIGINGGTFDPVHYGHLRPALEAMQSLGLHQVRFVPCYQPVHKDQPNVSADERCAMIELAIQHQPQFVLDRIEIDQGGKSFMVDTLEQLKQRFPEQGLVLMMGTDAFAKFDRWQQWQRILELANLVVMHRPGEPVPTAGKAGQIFAQYGLQAGHAFSALQGQIKDLAVTQLDISSTLIREQLQAQKSAEYLAPANVIAYLQQQGLYQENETFNDNG